MGAGWPGHAETRSFPELQANLDSLQSQDMKSPYEGGKRRGEGYCRAQARRVIRPLLLSKIVGVRIYPLTLAMALAEGGGRREREREGEEGIA